MSTLTIRMPDDKTERLKTLAKSRGISVNKMFEEWATQALTERDVELRFRLLAAQGDPQAALRVLDRLDAKEAKRG
ncbi:MAG: ribbon-helix-helix protein, CopG family [Acidiferrobacter sp.]